MKHYASSLAALAMLFLWQGGAVADVILKVDFDENAAGVQDRPVVVANTITARVLLFLEKENLYAYKFSLRFASDLLLLPAGGIDDTPPTNPMNFREQFLLEEVASGNGGGFLAGFQEVRNFDGNLDAGELTPLGTTNGLLVGRVTFNLAPGVSELPTDRVWIMPGVFANLSNEVDADGFYNEATVGRIPFERLRFYGNDGFATITAVPEPGSLALLSLAAAGVGMHRLRRLFRSR